MAVRLAVDFGTATTCMATVPNVAEFRSKVIPIEAEDAIASTAVFLDRPNGSSPLVTSSSPHGRSPLGVFSSAFELFDTFWADRREARGCGVKWSQWMEGQPSREEGLLLTYFKPELADHPVRVPIRVPRITHETWDPMAQFAHMEVEYHERSAASPDPDTHDLVSATAAVLQSCVRTAVSTLRPGERISMLAIGMPSFSTDLSSPERARAESRRREAVEMAGIAKEFGTSDFRVELYGEAEAAAWGVDIDADRQTVYKIIVDVGAGTTDLALVEYHRDRGGRYRVVRRVSTESLRYGGRDLNLALSMILRDNAEFRDGVEVLDAVDQRAWQYVMEHEVERLKCGLSEKRRSFGIDFSRASTFEAGNFDLEKIARALRRTAFFQLAANDQRLRVAVGSAVAKEWLPKVSSFIRASLDQIADRRDFVGVEKVGGAFRFAPLNAQLLEALRQNGLPLTQVQFRDEGGEAQTMVARGLARWAALQE